MKAIYQKPTIKDDEFSLEAIMISTSNGGQTLVEDGGSTSGSVTSGDSRAWGWDDDDDDY